MTTFMPHALTVLVTLFVWWFSTGIIVYLDGLPKRTYRWSFGCMTVIAALALVGLWLSAGGSSVSDAGTAFVCAILVWGWNEMGFLMGFITGPRPEACPPNVTGRERFMYATKALLYHEVAIVGSLGLIGMITSGQVNQFGFWTFGLLWLMRLSAKLNLFLGVPNRTEEFLPEGLSYLKSYFRSACMNPLLPFSITFATIGCVLLVQLAGATDAGRFEATGFGFLAALLGLAIVEHWLMIVPIPASLLWGWGLKSHEKTARDREGMSGNAAGMRPATAGLAKQNKTPGF